MSAFLFLLLLLFFFFFFFFFFNIRRIIVTLLQPSLCTTDLQVALSLASPSTASNDKPRTTQSHIFSSHCQQTVPAAMTSFHWHLSCLSFFVPPWSLIQSSRWCCPSKWFSSFFSACDCAIQNSHDTAHRKAEKRQDDHPRAALTKIRNTAPIYFTAQGYRQR